MTTNYDRRLENAYITNCIELTEVCLEIPFDSAGISNPSPYEKIRIRKIAFEVDPGGGYPFNLQIDYSTKQWSSYYIYNIQINQNLRTQKMFDIGQIIVTGLRTGKYVPSDVDVNFDYMNEYEYLCIQATIPADNSFTFYLMGDWTNDYFSLPDGIAIIFNRVTIKVYSFNGENYYYPLSQFDLYHSNLRWNLRSTANSYICEMMDDKDANYIKECQLDSMKLSAIIGSKKGVHMGFTCDGNTGVYIYYKRLVLEYVILYGPVTNLIDNQFLALLFWDIWSLILRILISPSKYFEVGLGVASGEC